MAKSVAVFFSGGLDSTYLVWKNLKEGNFVNPVYVEIGNNKVKTIIEKNRIGLLVKELRNEFRGKFSVEDDMNVRLRDIGFVLSVNVDVREDSLLFKQVPIWILAALYCQSMLVDEIQIGYISNDDAISFLPDIQNTYQSYKEILTSIIPLTFPLLKKHKWEIIRELPKQYHKYIFSCENAKIVGREDAEFIEYEPCCYCTPCRHVIADDYYGLGFPENYNKNLIYYHASALLSHGFSVNDKEGNNYFNNTCAEPARLPYQLELDFYNNDEDITKGYKYCISDDESIKMNNK